MKALFTDLDDTLYHPANPAGAWEVYDWCRSRGWLIAVITGIGMADYQARLASGELPLVDAVAAHVGTDIWYPPVAGQPEPYQLDQDFIDDAPHRQFDRAAIVTKGEELIAQWKQERPELQFDWQRPADPSQPYKVSFYMTVANSELLESLRQKLTAFFAPWPVIISDHTAYNRVHVGKPRKYCVDVVPITKTGAVDYLMSRWGVDSGVVAGDSGNDVDMLLASRPELISVLVGSAKPEALEAIMAATQSMPKHEVAWRQLIGHPEKLLYLPADISLTPAILEACVLPK